MTFDTHLSMTTHKMGEYWLSEDVKFQCLRNTSGIAVKVSEWTRDVGGVTRNVVFVGEVRRTSYTKKKRTSPVRHLTVMSMLIYRRTQKTSDTDSEGSVQHLGIEQYQYEPYLSDAGAGKDGSGGSESDGTGAEEDDGDTERLGNNKWLVALHS